MYCHRPSMPDLFAKATGRAEKSITAFLDKVLEGLTSKRLFEYSLDLADRFGAMGSLPRIQTSPGKVFLPTALGMETRRVPLLSPRTTRTLLKTAAVHCHRTQDGISGERVRGGIENTVLIEHGGYRILTNNDESIIVV